MERDVRRASGQWRGCSAFEGIICDGDGSRPKRSGGLKMGQTYYYYVGVRKSEAKPHKLTAV
jgi:hypothetical protein